jgi:hypothetical protein
LLRRIPLPPSPRHPCYSRQIKRHITSSSQTFVQRAILRG